MKKDTFNDRMVKRTVIPTIYLWLIASGSVVGMGIYKPEVVLTNLDGFIALIAIISGVAAPALATILRMWETEQQTEIENIPTQLTHERQRHSEQHTHSMKQAAQTLTHTHDVEKFGVGMSVVSQNEDGEWDA